MKKCRACLEEKPGDAFYPYNQGRCKACLCEQVKRHRRESDYVREYDRERAKSPERRAANRATVIAWRAANPEKYKAQTALGNAVRAGKIKKKPCQHRGCKETKVHAHHDDYSKPLKVRWLCAKHHHRGHHG